MDHKRTPNLITKLSNIQARIKAPKDQYNQHGRFPYRTAEDILEALKPHLEENRVAILMSDTPVEISGRFYIKVTATLLDCDSDQTIMTSAYAREPEQRTGFDASQISGASSSYARKMCLCGLLAVDGEKDADVTNADIGQGSQGRRDSSRATTRRSYADGSQQAAAQPVKSTQTRAAAQPAQGTAPVQPAVQPAVKPVPAQTNPASARKAEPTAEDKKAQEEIIALLNKYPHAKLFAQIKDRYGVSSVNELTGQNATQCLACLRSYDAKKQASA